MAKKPIVVISHIVPDSDRDNLKFFTSIIGNWVSNPRIDRRLRIDGTISGQVNIFAKESTEVIFDVCTLDFNLELIRLGKTIQERMRLNHGK